MRYDLLTSHGQLRTESETGSLQPAIFNFSQIACMVILWKKEFPWLLKRGAVCSNRDKLETFL